MAIALRGSASIPAANPTTGFSVTIDAAVVAGDVLFLTVTSRDSTVGDTIAVTDNDTGGNAWARAASSSDDKATIWWKRATSGTASKTVTVANAIGSCSGVLKAFSGAVASGNPYDTSVFQEINAPGDETHAAWTPDNADSMVCMAIFNLGNDNSVTSLSGATIGAFTVTEKLSTGGSDCANAFGHVLQVGGPTSTGTITWAQNDGASVSVGFTIPPAVATFLHRRTPPILQAVQTAANW